MRWFLIIYLVISGGFAALALMMPGLLLPLVMFAVFPIFGVVPAILALILLFAPTAFLYGALFAVVWFRLQARLGHWTATAAGLAFVASVVLGVPALSHFGVSIAIAYVQRLDAEPASGLASPSGILRIQQERIGWGSGAIPQTTQYHRDTYVCDHLCAATLFTPGITAVTMAAPVGGNIRPWPYPNSDLTVTYRLAPLVGADCPDPKLAVEGSGIDSWPEIETLRTAWTFALSGGTCLMRDLGLAQPVADWTLSLETEPLGGMARLWNLGMPMELTRLVLANRAGTVVRRTAVSGSLLSNILWFEPTGGMMAPSSFGPARRSFTKGVYAPIEVLKRTTNLGLTIATTTAAVPTGEELRARLATALANPTLPADAIAFGLVQLYLQGFGTTGGKPDVREGDAALLGHLIADTRVRSFDGIDDAIRALGPESASLRAPMVARVLEASAPKDVGFAKVLGAALGHLPPATFATSTPEETRLLADDQRRHWAVGLVVRQSDRGAAAAPELVRIVAQAYVRPEGWNSDRLDDASAAVKALCVLGPDAANVLPDLEALIKTKVIPRDVLNSPAWERMFLRLGETIKNPAKPLNLQDMRGGFETTQKRALTYFGPENCL